MRLRARASRGSIPAGAGETSVDPPHVHPCEVDPRGCGGDRAGSGNRRGCRGRSPRVRGRPTRVRAPWVLGRSIPAGAGETMLPAPSVCASKVDPRGCGGDAVNIAKRQLAGGRSPRVRGRRVDGEARRRCGGSIPAGAGETRSSTPTATARRVDPRGCGGDAPPESAIASDEGRSPRVRGRRRPLPGRLPARRSIPAGAGETRPRAGGLRRRRVDPRGCGGDLRAVVIGAGG